MERKQRGETSVSLTVTAGVLILLGTVFLLRNFDLIDLGGRWWALFFLIPLFILGSRLFEVRRSSGGGFPAEARGLLTGFLFIALVMVIFLFDLDWGEVWPLFIILVGVSFLFGRSMGNSTAGKDPGS